MPGHKEGECVGNYYFWQPEWWAAIGEKAHTAFIEGDRWRMYLDGLVVTLEVTALALILGFLLGTAIAIVRAAHDQWPGKKMNPLLIFFNFICKLFITVIRGTPAMVQLIIMYLVIFSSTRNTFGVAVLTFGINSSAYVSEIIRGGIMSVDRGQMEAGRSLGLGYYTTMSLVIIPQAFKAVLPALGNELITLMKETSIVTVIGLRDVTKAAMLIGSKTYDYGMPLFAIALVYLLIVIFLTWLLGKLERRLRNSER
jgi:His/Glu/Gln/Arg/opine family amino acid ABC transporter permease subunit